MTRRVPLVGQGQFSLSHHLNYHLDFSGVFCVMQCRSLFVLSFVCPVFANVSGLSISDCSFDFTSVYAIMDIQSGVDK